MRRAPDIAVESLVKQFGAQRALDNVSFRVAEGELFTLLGPSGCGKSTTLMSIAGFQTPEDGRIEVGGDVFFDAARRLSVPAERRNLGIVFQSYAVWPHMTVFQNLAFPLKVRKTKRGAIHERVLEVLDLVEMGDYAARYPHQLSGGQQQRVALARALVYSPSVLLLDEPFSNLDAKLRERARAWVKELQIRLGLTTIFVTHDQDEALSMSDRVAVMSSGEIQQIGTPEAIYRRPSNRFVAEFVGRVNLLSGTVAAAERGRVALELADGRKLWVDAEHTATPNAQLTLAVRPEALRVEAADASTLNGSNTLEARVESVAFLGDHYQYELRAGDLALTAQTARAVAGERVKVHIPADACAIVD
ncbi:MAG TPA: ABC transporter ATP-binding protein [Gaiellaceae bacterium]|nr:ABC transporter ATP-binding protein [Gaiellaceae bacterium]